MLPGEDWQVVDGAGELEQGALIADALQYGSKANLHHLYARIVALEPRAYGHLPWSVRELFKHRGGGQYWFWDTNCRKWSSEDAKDCLFKRHMRCPGEASEVVDHGVPGGGAMATQLADASPQSLCVALAEAVEKLLRSALQDLTFQ